jgi:hypothetical protein
MGFMLPPGGCNWQLIYPIYHYIITNVSQTKPGSAISYGREPRSCLSRVFNFKLDSIVS